METTKKILRTLIAEWLTREIPDAKKRDIEIPLDSDKIISLIVQGGQVKRILCSISLINY